jgi:hypothetical protein
MHRSGGLNPSCLALLFSQPATFKTRRSGLRCEGPGFLNAFSTRGGLRGNAGPEARAQALER